MEKERCSVCLRAEDEVKLLDAVNTKEISKICEECAILEDIPVIRKPSSEQLDAAQRAISVRNRIKKILGNSPEESVSKPKLTLDDLRKAKTSAEIFNQRMRLAQQRNKPLNLIENYHWSIMLARKQKKITRSQLAKAIGEEESIVKMIENKEMPDDALRVIKKLEQYLGIVLRKEEAEKRSFEQKKREAEEFEKVHQELLKIEQEDLEAQKLFPKKTPTIPLIVDRNSLNNITIADLKKMKEEREKAEKKIIEDEEHFIEREKEAEEKYAKAEHHTIKDISNMVWRNRKKKN